MRILKFEKCYGLQLTKRIELWIAMPHYTMPKHTHPQQDCTIIHIFSNSELHRVRSGVEQIGHMQAFKCMFKRFLLLGSDIHWFTTRNLPLIFLNIKHKASNVSPAKNLKLTTFN